MSSIKPGNIRKTLNISSRFLRKQPFGGIFRSAEAILTNVEYLYAVRVNSFPYDKKSDIRKKTVSFYA